MSRKTTPTAKRTKLVVDAIKKEAIDWARTSNLNGKYVDLEDPASVAAAKAELEAGIKAAGRKTIDRDLSIFGKACAIDVLTLSRINPISCENEDVICDFAVIILKDAFRLILSQLRRINGPEEIQPQVIPAELWEIKESFDKWCGEFGLLPLVTPNEISLDAIVEAIEQHNKIVDFLNEAA